MKNALLPLFFAAALAALPKTPSAQVFRYGITGGGGAARFDFAPPAGGGYFDILHDGFVYNNGDGFRPAAWIGATAERPFSNRFMVSAAVLCSFRSRADSVQGYGSIDDRVSQRLFALHVPLTAHLTGQKATIGAGIFATMGVAGRVKEVYSNYDVDYYTIGQKTSRRLRFGKPSNSDDLRHLRRLDAGLRAEAGFPLRQVRLAVAFEQGLANLLANRSNQKETGQGRVRSQAIYATATYFWLKK